MTRVEFAPAVAADFDRIFDYLARHDVAHAASRIDQIVRAIDVLQQSPRIGRPVERDLRELVIGRKSRGYLALYRYVEAIDTVFVLAVRSQSEAGYAG
ncbi:MAG: type II toxin-antitoxin system RelE/ParE family toxin [Burkholderiaceae bacterium]|jgi:plasmid stabilization system protein ParE|nr:type II toxin-antitoxin system RelE/ParE family toxin [Burkholderiaceae bacterium]